MLQAEQVLHNRYQLKQKLGQNAGHQTWLAVDLIVEPQSVVLKLLTVGGDVTWSDLKLFEREAQVLNLLDHPRIPKYRDYFGIDDRSLWFGLVHDYIPGASLKDILVQGQKFTEPEIRKIATEVLQILQYLHQFNPPILHRDIKPSNLIWSQDNQIYLVDFGGVQHQAAREGVTFTVVGTYGYAPVEQFGGRTVPASDLYALGATLIHLLTGVVPANLPQRRMQIQFADCVHLSPSLVRWIEKLTQPCLEERFATAEQALKALLSGEIVSGARLQLQPSSLEDTDTGGLVNRSVVPREIKVWNLGAFLLAPFWSVSNRVYLGLLCWLPWVVVAIDATIMMSNHPPFFTDLMLEANAIMAYILPLIYLTVIVLLGLHGNKWAWRSNHWQSLTHFKIYQQRWAMAGICLGPFFLFSTCYIWTHFFEWVYLFVN